MSCEEDDIQANSSGKTLDIQKRSSFMKPYTIEHTDSENGDEDDKARKHSDGRDIRK